MINAEEREALVKYRLQRANETMNEVSMNIQNKFWNATANRLYYASFYAVSALLVQNGYNTQTHKGVKTLFSQHFVKTSLIGLEKSALYNELFDKRQTGDYADFFDWTEEDILPLIEPTKELIETIKKLIQTEN